MQEFEYRIYRTPGFTNRYSVVKVATIDNQEELIEVHSDELPFEEAADLIESLRKE